MRFRVLFALVALAACGGGGSQLAQDLRSAEASCDKDWPTKSQLVACLDTKDHQVWAKEEPATLDLYDSFARKRDALARDFDEKKIDKNQYFERLRKLKDETRAQMAARRGEISGSDQAPAQP
jgi:hypothetical protein